MTILKRVLVSMISIGVAAFVVWCWPHATTYAVLAEEKRSGNEVVFEKTVRPVLRDYCVTCHSTEKQKGELDLERFTTVASIKNKTEVWEHVLEQLANGEMPPKSAKQMSVISFQYSGMSAGIPSAGRRRSGVARAGFQPFASRSLPARLMRPSIS